jgi:aryl-alcohol dehydrogenase-like predicted oxidoreductase
MKRRTFIRHAAGAAGLLGLFPAGLSAITREQTPGKLEKRTLGRTGLKLSILGFGGIVVMNATPEQSSERVKAAIDRGINFFDVAPSYGDAEEKLGPALKPYRKDIVLACKTGVRDKAGARRELEASLKKLETDYFDLYQLHAVTELEDVDRIFAPNGAMEMILEAKDEGLIKHIGFSAHSVEAAMALMDRFNFDTIMFPFSASSWYAGNFGPKVMQRAHEKEMGILALKAMAKGHWREGAERNIPKAWYEPMTDPDEARLGLRFALSHPITLALPPGNEDLFEMAMRIMPEFEPLTNNEIERIKREAAQHIPLFTHEA